MAERTAGSFHHVPGSIEDPTVVGRGGFATVYAGWQPDFHRRVAVKVIDADFVPGNGPPFIVFEYIDGLDVGEMIEGSLFGPEDALELARQVASGLVHLHEASVGAWFRRRARPGPRRSGASSRRR